MANLTPWINYSNGDNLVDIRTKLNNFNTEVNAQVDANTAGILTTTGILTAHDAEITTLQTEVTTNTADITTAQDAIIANVIAVDTNTANIVTLEAKVDTNTADIATAQDAIIANVIAVNTNTVDINAAGDAIVDNAMGIVDNAADIVTLETKVDTNAPFTPSYSYANGSNIVVASTTYTNILTLTTGTLAAGVYKLSQSMLYSLDSTNTSAFFRFSTDGGATWSEMRREPKDNTDVLPHTYISTGIHLGGVFELQIEARKESNGDTLTVSAIDAIFERKA